jgi:hypothetical protein
VEWKTISHSNNISVARYSGVPRFDKTSLPPAIMSMPIEEARFESLGLALRSLP